MKKKRLTFLTILTASLLLVGCQNNTNPSNSSVASKDSLGQTSSNGNSNKTSCEDANIKGDGTKDNPYLIANKTQLTKFNELASTSGSDAYYKLTQDIDYLGDEWNPVGRLANPFSGSIDGDGHKISNIKISKFDKEQIFYGFLGYAEQASIKNLNIDAMKITMDIYGSETQFYYGGVVGYGVNTSFDNVHVNFDKFEIKSLQNNSSQTIAGGLIGFQSVEIIDETMYYVSLSNSSVIGDIKLDMKDAADTVSGAAGLVGYTSTGSFAGIYAINNSYFHGNIEAGTYAAGITSRIGYYTSIIDSYAYGDYIKATSEDGAYAGGIVSLASYETALIGCVSDYNNISASNSNSTVYKSYAGGIAATISQDAYDEAANLKGTAIYNSYYDECSLAANILTEGSKETISSSLFKDKLNYVTSVWDLSSTYPTHVNNPTLDKAIVTFDKNYDNPSTNETLEINAGEYNSSIAIKTTDDKLERENYSFQGYYYDQKATVEYRWYAPINRDLTLYAGWSDLTKVIGTYSYICEYSGQVMATGYFIFDETYFYWVSADNMIFKYYYTLKDNYILIGECVSEPISYYDGEIFIINEDGTITGYDINDSSATYTATKTSAQIDIPDYSNQDFLGLWYNSKVAVNLLANGNAIAYNYDDGKEVKYSGAYRMNNNSMEIAVFGRIAKSTYTYDTTNNIFISTNDVLTREKSKIYNSESIMVVVTESKTYVIENSSISNKVIEGNIEEGATIKIGETEYTVKGTTLVAKTEEVVTPPTPGPGDDSIPSYCGTWTGKVGINNYTVIVKSDGTLIINGDSYTYTYNNGTLTNNSPFFTITYNESNKSLKVVYDDGDYQSEGTLTTFVKEENSGSDTPVDTRPMSEQVVGTYEGKWGVSSFSNCRVVLTEDGTGYFENDSTIIANFTYTVDDKGIITCTITDQYSSYENLNFIYNSETQILTGSVYEWDQMLTYTFNVAKKA